jgi:hypothetical protein
MFGTDNASDATGNADDAADAGNAIDAPVTNKTAKVGPHRSRPER